MAHDETPGFGVGTPTLGTPAVGPHGPDDYLGTRAGDPGTGTAPAHGPDFYLGTSWNSGGESVPTPTAGTEPHNLTERGDDYTSSRRENGLGVSDYV